MPSGLLSSGLDSFVVNKFLTKKFTNFKTYTLGFEQDSFDEIRNFNKEFEIFNKNFFKLDKKILLLILNLFLRI